MPFYIRKAISFGPLRFNLSKSGVGVSAGVKGFRVGSGPAGNYVHAGRHGLYYKKFFSSGKGTSGKNFNDSSNIFSGNTSNGGDTIIDSGSVLEMVDSKSSQLIDEINEKNKLFSFLPLAIFISILLNAYLYLSFASNGTFGEPLSISAQLFLFISSIYFCVKVRNKDYLRKTTILMFELDDDLKNIYEKLYNSIEELSSSKKISNVHKSTSVHNSKYHAGAGQLIDRNDVSIKFKNPKFLNSNIDIPCMPAGKESLYFLPTTLLVAVDGVVGAVPYELLKFEASTVRFIEDSKPVSDANIVDTTWEKVNKDGSPDRRFANNRQLPVVQYNKLKLNSSSGLNEMFYISKDGVLNGFTKNLGEIRKYYTKIPIKQKNDYSKEHRNWEDAYSKEEKEEANHFDLNQDTNSDFNRYKKILGLKGNVKKIDIHKAYKKKMKEYHPDKVSTMADELKDLALLRTKEINAAYDYFKKKYKL